MFAFELVVLLLAAALVLNRMVELGRVRDGAANSSAAVSASAAVVQIPHPVWHSPASEWTPILPHYRG